VTNLEWGMLLFYSICLSADNVLRSLNTHSVHGPVVNPFKPTALSSPPSNVDKRSAGGSSGGSAAAVASGMCHA